MGHSPHCLLHAHCIPDTDALGLCILIVDIHRKLLKLFIYLWIFTAKSVPVFYKGGVKLDLFACALVACLCMFRLHVLLVKLHFSTGKAHFTDSGEN